MYWIKQFPYLQRFLLINLSLSAELSAEFSGVKSWNPHRTYQPYQFSHKDISIVSSACRFLLLTTASKEVLKK